MLLTFLFLFRSFECTTFGYPTEGLQQFANAVLNGLYHHYTCYNVAYDEAAPLLKNPNSLFSRLLASFKTRFEGHKKLLDYKPDVTIRDEIWTACVNKAQEDGAATNVAGYRIFDILSKDNETKYWIKGFGRSSADECFLNLGYLSDPNSNSKPTISFWVLESELNSGVMNGFFMSTKNFKGEMIWYDASFRSDGKEELEGPEEGHLHLKYGITENIHNFHWQMQKKLRLSGQAPPTFTDTHYVHSFSFDCPDEACLDKAELFFGNNQIIHRKTKGIFRVCGVLRFPLNELGVKFFLKVMFASFFVRKYDDDIWKNSTLSNSSDCSNFKIFMIASKAFEREIPPNTQSILIEGRTTDEIEFWLRSKIGPNQDDNNVCFMGFNGLRHTWIYSFHQLPINLICLDS